MKEDEVETGGGRKCRTEGGLRERKMDDVYVKRRRQSEVGRGRTTLTTTAAPCDRSRNGRRSQP